jgi:hypothetical protein
MTTIAAKADHVRAARGTGNHHCHWPGCEAKVPPAMWGCRKHWYALPQALRNKIWRAYRPGQEATKTPSREYVEVAREVQAWIAMQGSA